MNRNELVNLLNKHAEIVNLGTSEDAPSTEWVNNAEKALSIKLPSDYKWFLETYGGGDICGEEIYSIYSIPFDEAVGGDIVYQNVISSNNIMNGYVVISNTDFGEEFFFDIKDMEKIYISLGAQKELYANNFIEYLNKRLMSYI
ncbi:1,3-beta-glucan synthase regulator [Listeria monocytogenes]|uniref:SMI1/KNR4 family protein n=1 Tax=Listeria monocytogenes TaxID=1639 RepID=UPI000873CDEC|nr:SMI1/KNR4 family protein [Listeria monocytogenes]EAC4734695.1 SMI1/KNR4 family protein [Listeria monocytogenes]EGY1137495.1 SMI1/KNR4 family protein [Listeria monocytogenes]OFG33351.1 1,3-beta-glucan synthase regulator [Listeria monocytogenes]